MVSKLAALILMVGSTGFVVGQTSIPSTPPSIRLNPVADADSANNENIKRNEVELTGVLRIKDKILACLRHQSSGIIFIKEGESAFGYVAKRISLEEGLVQLERDGLLITLKLVPQGPVPQSPSVVEAQRVIDGWYKYFDSLPLEQQPSSDAIRQYWQEQWTSGLAEFVLKNMTADEQTRFREELSRSWRK